jgi:hypothetical protein
LRPYIAAVAGGEMRRVSASIAGYTKSASDTRAVFGGGPGVLVGINRHVGI